MPKSEKQRLKRKKKQRAGRPDLLRVAAPPYPSSSARAPTQANIEHVESDDYLLLRGVTHPVARKEYTCDCPHEGGELCGKAILPGDQYSRITAIDQGANNGEGKYLSFIRCQDCNVEGPTAHEA